MAVEFGVWAGDKAERHIPVSCGREVALANALEQFVSGQTKGNAGLGIAEQRHRLLDMVLKTISVVRRRSPIRRRAVGHHRAQARDGTLYAVHEVRSDLASADAFAASVSSKFA